jgi:hypothetical protein
MITVTTEITTFVNMISMVTIKIEADLNAVSGREIVSSNFLETSSQLTPFF